ncbi:response regulator [Paenibacillus glycanilyticus]|uniref:response regulator n=1 Tax=Paenibacillus glycanilyticus TaxID=126569 RepID=UPI000FDB7B61|nr:response regulator [Paenibacillus glycanilyticus]
MVYKVMLVDDESIDLEWLQRRIPWGNMGMQVTAQFNSSFHALNKLSEQPVDILITDINMPIMSGLELARKAKAQQSELIIIFVSGHEEFDYAKQALQMSAFGYVLKPFQDSELLQLLEQAIDHLNAAHYRNNEQRQWAEALPLLKSEQVIQWLEGAFVQHREEAEAYIRSSFYGHRNECGFMIIMIEIDDVEWKLNRLSVAEKEALMNKVIGIIDQAVGNLNYTQVKLIKPAANRFTVIIPVPKVVDPIIDTLTEAINQVKQSTLLTVTIALGQKVEHIEGLPQSYDTARKLLSYKMFLGKNRILEEQSVKGNVSQEAIDLELKVESLFIAMSEYNLVRIDDLIQQLFRFMTGLESRVTVYQFVIHLISRLGEKFRQAEENLYDLLHWDYKHLDVLFQFETIDDIQSWLRRRFFELSEKLYAKKQRQNRKTIDQIKNYVKTQIEHKPTLRDVSRVFAFSPNYLGYMFKEETGENFSEFLVRMRLERACELLLDPAIKIYEITERIGYKNIIYFNRQFKEHYGMTPSDYRRLHKI